MKRKNDEFKWTVRKTILFSLILAALTLVSIKLIAGGNSSIKFDKPAYKLGDKATGKWTVDSGYQIIDSKATEHFSKPNIPHKNGPASGTFELDTLKYSKKLKDAGVFMMLKNKKTGASEDEKNALRSFCTIVGIEGEVSGISVFPFKTATIHVKTTGMPKQLGDITDVEISKISIATDPSTPFKFSTSGNSIEEEELFISLDPSGGKKNFAGAVVITTLKYAGMTFTSKGSFTAEKRNMNLRASFK